jgi:hypothetical protein
MSDASSPESGPQSIPSIAKEHLIERPRSRNAYIHVDNQPYVVFRVRSVFRHQALLAANTDPGYQLIVFA